MKTSYVLAVSVLAAGGLLNQASAAAASPRLSFPSAQSRALNNLKKPIVGTWVATYTVQGNQVDKIYVQWHREGTASQANSHSPINGNVMSGDWTAAQDGTVSGSFAGWRFDNTGVLNGSFTKTESIAVNGDAYTGDFDLKIFDLNGNLLNEVTGDIAAARLSP